MFGGFWRRKYHDLLREHLELQTRALEQIAAFEDFKRQFEALRDEINADTQTTRAQGIADNILPFKGK